MRRTPRLLTPAPPLPLLGPENILRLERSLFRRLLRGYSCNERRVLGVLTNERRVSRVLTNERRVLRVLTNKRRVLRVLTNESPVLPGQLLHGDRQLVPVHSLTHLKHLTHGGAARLVHKVRLRRLKPALRLLVLLSGAVGYCRGPRLSQ